MSELDAHHVQSIHARHLRGLFEYLGSHRRDAKFRQAELLDDYLAGLDQRAMFALIAAIDALLRRNDSDAGLATQLREFGLTEIPAGGRSVRAWLRDLRHQLAQ